MKELVIWFLFKTQASIIILIKNSICSGLFNDTLPTSSTRKLLFNVEFRNSASNKVTTKFLERSKWMRYLRYILMNAGTILKYILK